MGKLGKTILGGLLIVGGLVVGLVTQNWQVAVLMMSEGAGILLAPKIKGLAERQGTVLENRTGSQNGLPVIYGKTQVGGVLADVRVDAGSASRKLLFIASAYAHGSQDGAGVGGFGDLAVNPGGEIGTLGAQATSWANAGGNGLLVADDFAKIGSRSMKITNTVAADSINQQSVTLVNGHIYRLSAWVKTSALPSADAGFGALVSLSGSNFTILEKITQGADNDSTKPIIGVAADNVAHDWVYVSCLFKATAGGAVNLICQLGKGGTQSGIAWFDEVHVEEVPVEVWFDDRKAIDTLGVVQAPFNTFIPNTAIRHLDYLHHMGAANQVVDTRLNARFATAWPSTSAGKGIAYARFELWYNTDVFPSGVPQVQFLVYGSRVYDPRDKTLKWSQNPALCIRDYLTSPVYGLGIPWANIDDQAFIDMANYCDEVVTIPGAGTGPRYTCNGWVDTNRSVHENLMQLCSSCRGQVINQGDRWRLFIRRARPVSGFQISEDNTLEGSWSFRIPGGDVPNVVRVQYVDPAQKYQADSTQWPAPGAANVYLVADNNIESRLEIDLPFTTDRARAEQLAMTIWKEQRKSTTISCTLKESALALQVGDIAEVTYPSPGWSSKDFDVIALLLQSDGGVQAVMTEYDPTAYDLDTQSAPATVPGTGLPDPFTVAAPTSLNLLADPTQFLTQPDGSQIPRIKATWTPPSDPFFKKIEVEARPQAGGDANFALTAGMLSHSGLSAFTAANCVDGDIGNNAWHTDSAVPGATLQVDLGVGGDQAFRVCKIWVLTPGGYAGIYDIEYSDNASSWSVAYAGFCPSVTGLNSVSWPTVGAHRYWRLNLKNTPGSGTWLTELAFVAPQYDQHGMVDEASDQVFYVTPATGPWDVRIRAVNKLGVTSAWVSGAITVGDRTPQALSITLDFTIAGAVNATVQADSNAGSLVFVGRKDRFPTLAELLAATGQQVVNPGFESGTDYWGLIPNGGSASVVTDPTKANTGSKYLLLSSLVGNFCDAQVTSDQAGTTKREFPVVPGQVITFGGWGYKESGTSDGYFVIQTIDSSHTVLGTVSVAAPASTGVWTFMSGTYTVAAGIAFISLFAEVNHTGTAAVVRFDDAFVQVNAIDVPHNGRNASATVIDQATGLAMVLDDSQACYLSAIAYTQSSATGTAGPVANGRATWTFHRRRSIFTSGSSFVVPSDWNNSRNTVQGIGGGGGGGGGLTNTRGGGGGGGGGASTKNNITLTLGTSVSYAIGGGGGAGTAGGNNGGNGGNTTFNVSSMIANGGVGGLGSNPPTGGAGGSGTGDVTHTGGNGTNGTVATNGSGGGGGGAAGFGTNGGNPAAGTPADPWGTGQGPGAGGGGGTPPTPTAGIAGSNFGGGGGGGACIPAAQTAGAAGAPGILAITWYG